ncbi:hypothetical protein CEXT_729971 [Caerostris extrusa]|uniref:Uncharacterized protein n=1 Tax=Caerostris extrusa TaxID=172846 RepID=A0AAV4PED3_CAEEX|nr:hypothetical protein CEXT_729971 [Caerostris extrusa]
MLCSSFFAFFLPRIDPKEEEDIFPPHVGALSRAPSGVWWPFRKEEPSLLQENGLVLQPTYMSDGLIECIRRDGMLVILCCEEN